LRRKLNWLISLLFSFVLLQAFGVPVSFAVAKRVEKKESPSRVLLVRNFKWASGGMGVPGILREITIENTGRFSYEELQVEAEFYTVADVPLGSLRSTIRDVIAPGEIKTYKNLNFGIMHSPLEKTVLRVATAKTVSTGVGAYLSPSEMVFVKGWEWAGGLYGTEGILKSITLENRGGEALKNIEILVEYLGGNIKRSYTRGIIQGVLPANSTKTFEGVNVGFRHPEANKAVITVIDAEPAVVKEKTVRRIVRKILRKTGEEPVEQAKEAAPETPTGERRRRIIEKRAQTERTTSNAPSEEIAGGKEQPKVAEEVSPQGEMVEKGLSRPGESRGEEYIEVEEEEVVEETPVPDQDIIVKKFRIRNTVPYSIGYIDELTLENVSTVTYRMIELTVDFYSRTDNRPLSSAKVTIPDVLPPNSSKTFKNVRIGFLNLSPEVVVIRVAGASVLR
jgi:hypothetical protein